MDEYAKLAFSKGIRAVYSEGEPEFSNLEGKQIPWSSLDNWLAIRQYQLIKEEASATWKERHAKGVPVKMTQGEWIDKCRGQYQQYPRFSDYPPTIASRGKVWTTAFDPIKGDVASFCNFRYKPEWLEKKGGNHAGV